LLLVTIKHEKDALCAHHKQAHTHIHTNPRQHNPISAQINEGHIEMSWVMRQLTHPLTFTPLLLINKILLQSKKNNEKILLFISNQR